MAHGNHESHREREVGVRVREGDETGEAGGVQGAKEWRNL
jgi:hypothetical protein